MPKDIRLPSWKRLLIWLQDTRSLEWVGTKSVLSPLKMLLTFSFCCCCCCYITNYMNYYEFLTFSAETTTGKRHPKKWHNYWLIPSRGCDFFHQLGRWEYASVYAYVQYHMHGDRKYGIHIPTELWNKKLENKFEMQEMLSSWRNYYEKHSAVILAPCLGILENVL